MAGIDRQLKPKQRDSSPGRGRQLLLAALALLGLLGPLAGSAQAAETTIGFDTLPGGGTPSIGTVITSQWASEGLSFGKATEFGLPEGTAGNCGPPSIGSGAVPAASEPNYAVLAKCVGALPSQGAIGALGSPPRGTLSLLVRNLTSTAPAHVTVNGYNSAGSLVVATTGEAASGEWTKLELKDKEAGIAYFSIVAGTANAEEVAIDNVSYEAAPTETTTTTTTSTSHTSTTSGGATPVGPTAVLALGSGTPHGGESLTLNGGGSSGGSGHIISYGWNFRGGEQVETSTGTNPLAHVIMAPGLHTVSLTVTNSNHEHSTTHLSLNVGPSVTIHLPDGGEGECLPSLEVGDAHLLAECIQKLPGGGYVIQGRLSLNGMTLVTKSGGFLHITSKRNYAIPGGPVVTQLSGAQVFIELENTPIGNLVLGERNLQAEPIVLDTSGGLGSLEALFHTARDGRAHTASGPSKVLLMAFGVGKECSGSESKKAGCCPPSNGLTACATLPGNFPLTGQVDVYLTNKGQALFDVQVGLSLKEVNFEATGALEIRANLESGIELQSLKFEIGEASLAPIFKVKGAKFEYFFPEYEEESKRDSWQAQGTITFGEEIAELEAELSFKKGEFHSASMKFKADPGVPIYPGIDLNEIGASVGVNPLAFGGSLGAKIAELLQLELAFKFREATSTELGFFGGEGKLSYKSDNIASLAADVYSDGYVDAQVKFNIHFPFESSNPVIEVSGGAGFWDEPASGLWQAKGNVYFKLWIISAEVAGLVNNQYAAGCLHVGAEGVFGGGIQGRYRFSDGNISGGLFGNDNCSDQLKQYAQKPLKTHSGGFVTEESAVLLPRLPGLGQLDLASARPAAATGSYQSFDLPGNTLGQELRISSQSGTPVLSIAGPHGQIYKTPAAAGELAHVPGQFMAAVAPNPDEVLVLLRHPQGGEWRIQSAAGSPAIAKVEAAEDLPAASLSARVLRPHRRHHSWQLRYRIGNYLPGSTARIVERGSDSSHLIATVHAARGVINFKPVQALGRSRSISAYLMNGEGAVVREVAIAHYMAPGHSRLPAPRKLHFARHGSGATLSFAPVPGAFRYHVRILGSDGRVQSFILRANRHSVSIANALGFERFSATVTPIDKLGLKGIPGSVHLKALSRKRAGRHGKHGRRHH